MSTPYSEDLVVEKYLKESIIDQARAIYGRDHPQGHTWSVIIDNHGRLTEASAHVIVYTSPNSLQNWLILESSVSTYSSVQALKDLLDKMQRSLAPLTH